MVNLNFSDFEYSLVVEKLHQILVRADVNREFIMLHQTIFSSLRMTHPFFCGRIFSEKLSTKEKKWIYFSRFLMLFSKAIY